MISHSPISFPPKENNSESRFRHESFSRKMNKGRMNGSVDLGNEFEGRTSRSGSGGNGSLSGGRSDASGTSKKQKNIPMELTAYGTTPSGKPRLFVCQTCTRAFARLEHLRRHERSHTKEKPFSCGVCQRKFSRRDLLLRHAQKLHAGCADAITRLRRKSLKRKSIDSLDEDAEPESHLPAESAEGPPEDVHFNLNLFNSQTTESPRQPDIKRNSLKDSNSASLHRRVVEQQNLSRNRGASFSAQSGANYAVGAPAFNDVYPGADNIEFSTPQFLPSTSNDESNWLNNLSSIPGMNKDNDLKFGGNLLKMADELRHNSISSGHFDNNIPSANVSHHGSFSNNNNHTPTHRRSDSLASASSFNTLDSMNNMGYMMPTATISNQEIVKGKNDKNLKEYGYSFYDIPESTVSNNQDSKSRYSSHCLSLTPIRQEDDESIQRSGGGSGTDNLDLNFLKGMDDLTHEYDVGQQFMPQGYSFYGDSQSAPSSGIGSAASFDVNSPIPQGGHNGHVSNGMPENVSGTSFDPTHFQDRRGVKSTQYSHNKLFTNNMRFLINKALSKYPISGIMTPTIPSNERLEFYLRTFVNVFLAHFPFIHISKLNEQEMMNMTAEESESNESSRVCLPLLIATIGALLANSKNHSEHLYEASRRTIHIYLESRKGQVESSGNSSSTSNPLWLIQSLTLSVVFGLFSENESNVYIVIRQLNALNSLVKSSVKAGRQMYFGISNEDSANLSMNRSRQNNSLFAFSSEDDIKFRNNIVIQSQTRIILTIYRLTSFLLMMYNVPLSLSINDLSNLSLPSKEDEFLWSFTNYQSFQEYCQINHMDKKLDEFCAPQNKFLIKHIIQLLRRSSFENSDLMRDLDNTSTFGFNTLLYSIFEVTQYVEIKNIDISGILADISKHSQRSSVVNSLSKREHEFGSLDFQILVSFITLCSLVDFKMTKEQSWLRNYEELARNYNKTLTQVIMTRDDDTMIKSADCCINLIKLVLFKSNGIKAEEYRDDHELAQGAFFNSGFEFSNLYDTIDNPFRSPPGSSFHYDAANNHFATIDEVRKLEIGEEFDNSRNSIHSQVVFHAFMVLSVFATYTVKRNNNMNYGHGRLDELNQRFTVAVELLKKIEEFLKNRPHESNSKIEYEFTNLYLYSSSMDIHSLEKVLYMLKIGELTLSYMYESNMKVCIFKKLAASLSQIRKFLIDNEASVMGGQ